MHQHINRFQTDTARWAAVVRRDAAADGAFYYSVRTTGVFCKPSCASRQAQRENVRFHATCDDARRGGFRPCKRCRPDRQPGDDPVVRACRLIEASDTLPSLDALAAAAGLSRFHFQRLFKRTTGVTPRAYATAVGSQRVRDLLPTSSAVTTAILGGGFRSSARFYAQADSLLGMRPKKYRAGGKDMTIRFAVGQCSLGAILVAATERGVCAISLGDNPQQLASELQKRFAQAELVANDKKFEQLVAQVVGFVEAPAVGLNLPLDIRGTAFQQRVWQALSAVKPGETITYTELARRIGAPKSVRAVAAACAANPLAVAIPCHRVVRKGGALAGYRWGIARKQVLLERESTA